jgi:hypothetical protein
MIEKLGEKDELYFDGLLETTGLNVNVRSARDESMLQQCLKTKRYVETIIRRSDVDAKFTPCLMQFLSDIKAKASVAHMIMLKSANPYKLYRTPFSGMKCSLRNYAKLSNSLYEFCLMWERAFWYWIFVTPRTLEWKQKTKRCYIAAVPEVLMKELVDFLLPVPEF